MRHAEDGCSGDTAALVGERSPEDQAPRWSSSGWSSSGHARPPQEQSRMVR
ncbi:hypothetical protein CU044_4259 [Streptomyces sp. L-9-10]|nr:hypothetical protein CU044_4259 [Streptomyces sp. L-9-10]